MSPNTEHIPNLPGGGGDENIDIENPRRDYSYLYDLIKGVAVVWGMNIITNVAGIFAIKYNLIGDILFMFLATAIIITTSFCVSVYFVCVRRGKSLLDGFSITPVRFPLWLIYILGAIVLSLVLNSFEPETLKQDSILYQILSTKSGKIAVAALIPFASIVEELYYRGFIFPILLRYLSPTVSILIVSLWFSAAHIVEYGGNIFAIFAVFILGLILTLERYYTKSLTPSLITHFFFNSTTMAMVFLMT